MVNCMRFVVRIHQNGWSYQELEAVWWESERLGYDGASLYDVLGINGPECWTALTALTARTRKLVAVPLVLSSPYRHPAVVARMAATLDAVCPGRIIVGLGAGGSDADAAAFGVRWPPTHAISPGCDCSLRRSYRSCEVAAAAGSSACARRAKPEFSY